MKFLISDFDGTLYQNKTITKTDENAILNWQENNNLFVIATGRDKTTLLKKLKDYNIKPDYIIGNNGVTLDNEVLNYLSPKIVINLLVDLLTFSANILVTTSQNGKIKTEIWNQSDLNRLTDDIQVLQISVKCKNKEDAQKFTELNQDKYKDTSFLTNLRMIDIVPTGVDKANAINLLLSTLNKDSNLAYTIGDGFNDLLMLENYKSATFPWAENSLLKVANYQVESVSQWIGIINNME